MRSFIPFEDARSLVLAAARLLPEESCTLGSSLGRTVSRDVTAPVELPAFASSGMDGFAVRAADLGPDGGTLTVIGHVAAGKPMEGTVDAGEAMRIMTGAPIPAGADSVVPVEWTDGHGTDSEWTSKQVVVQRGVDRGRNVRPAGEDVSRGAVVVQAGTVITPPVIGMLASIGMVQVPVRQRPRIALLTTGDEIVSPEKTPAFGQVRNSNGPGLAAQVVLAGGVCSHVLHAPDNPAILRDTIGMARDADILIATGGVSVGAHDYVQDELRASGFEAAFWKVQQRPGKPLLFGHLGSTLVFGLPGNPVSSAMCFEMYVRPLMAAMMGAPEVLRKQWPGVLAEQVRKAPGLHTFMRGTAEAAPDGRMMIRATGPQGSNLYSSVQHASCVVHLPAEMDAANEGADVWFEWVPW